MRRLAAWMIPVILLAFSCCRPRVAGPAPAGRLNVVVSILPQAYFVERVGGGNVTVSVLVGPGRSPATYEPTPKQLSALENADLFFHIGVPFENSLLPKIRAMYPDLVIVDTRREVPMLAMTGPHRHHDGEEDVDEEHHGALDPHTWLDPIRVKTQARTICDALKSADPDRSAEYEANLASFQTDLDEIHHKIEALLSPLRNREFYVFHPSFGYFADRYSLVQTAIEVAGKEPTARELAHLIQAAKRDGVKIIFVQAQFSKRAAEAIAAEIGAAVVQVDPLARNYLANIENMARKMAEALGGGGAEQ